MAGSTRDAREDDFDRRWEAITQELGDLQPAPADSGPPTDTSSGDDAGAAGSVPGDGWGDAGSDLGLSGPRDYEPAEEEGFVPPEPAPLRTAHRPWLAVGWVGLAASALTLLACAIFRAIPTIVAQVAGVVMLGSFVALLSQLPRARGEDGDDDPGKGAVV